MAIEKHIVELAARDTLSPALKRIGTEAETAGRKADDAGRRATRSTQDWGRAAHAVGTGLGLLAIAAVKLGADAEVAQTRLRQSVENTGHSYDEYADAVDRASKKALQLAFDDEDAARAIASLTDATGDASRAISDLALAEDIARGRGIDLAAATNIVIAAETGRFQSLKRMGIEVDANATKEEVLASLHAKYAGQATAYADTTAASYERMGNTIENVLESVGQKADDALLPLLALSQTIPILTTAATALGGTAALGGVAVALGTIGVAAAALAAPLGITTYLFIDQKNVVREATEATLENQKVLEGYMAYLNSIDVSSSAITEMTQQMKELLDWATKTSAAGMESLIDPNLLVVGDEFVATLGDMNDELRSLDPENLQSVQQLMHDLGVDVSDPNTWNAENISMVIQLIYLLSQQQKDAEYTAMELERANRLNAQSIDDTADAAEEASRTLSEMAGWQQKLTHTLTGEAVPAAQKQVAIYTEMGDAFENVDRRSTDFQGHLATSLATMADGIATTAALDDKLAALATTLETDFAGSASAAYDRVVGFTSGMVSAIGTSRDWADALIAPVGVYSELDKMLASGKIDIEDYNEAQQAQIDITNDLARATDAANIIQVKQADTVADGADATADYLETLAAMPEAQQALALAWADTDIAGQAMDVANLAAEFGNMNTAQQEAFGQMVTSAAATNPALAAVLVDLGLIKEDVSDPTGYTLTVPTDGAQATIQDVVDALDRVTAAILGIPPAVVSIGADTSNFWAAYNALPTFRNVIDFVAGKALGGVTPYGDGAVEAAALGRASAGRMTLVGEHGPELVNLPGGSLVTPNHATRYRPEVKGGGGMVFTGPITVVANDPQSFMRQMRSYATTMERR